MFRHDFPIIPSLASLFSRLSLKMLFLLFPYYLLQGPSIDAGPITTIENRSLAGNHCNGLGHCRTIWNIVWSCLVTIFITLGILLSTGIAFISILPAALLYILARAVTLILAFTSLRDLPPGAYETVHWTTFIPHV